MAQWITAFFAASIPVILLEYYAFQALKTVAKSNYIKWFWLLVTIAVYAYFSYHFFAISGTKEQTNSYQFAAGILLTFLVPKLFVVAILFSEDVLRMAQKLRSKFSSKKTEPLAGRREFLSKMALGIAAIPFVSFLYGIVEGRYNYKVLKYQLTFDDLPEAFNGLTITQISDIHSGSFTNKEKVQYGIDLINKQQSDLILFTGDLVNSKAEEMDDWIDVFKNLKAPLGKYSVLGNHDYGDYTNWETESDKEVNFRAIKDAHSKMGFDLLLNENRFLEKDGEQIAVLGVENWGKGFNKSGDLQQAAQGVKKEDFKILLTHDPSHWEHVVKNDALNYHLTLSGHTHGLQMGIEIPGFFKWSPSQYVYKQWAGLYNNVGRYINVNRGFGYHAFPGRVGIWPEITVIELKKGAQQA
ncbi:metallophosphoesterase [Oceanihabitans sp. IOP_32]|uniref:metallophosphoesterase n=1 Tax=Oceanihabitans sp. IOP_32 TaxID=2529032 RepID=UPI001293E7C7|nr:metallophosphoesterase [Oceanihabitans sp. IOP_32]QFZ54253.1 metallophosphoesterase [Oceanihabitans sp. IOP_32]